MTPSLTLSDWENLRRELIWIRRGTIEARYRKRTYQPAGRIVAWRLFSGSISFELPSGSFAVKAGQWVFPGMVVGERTFSEKAEFISIRFHAHWPDGASLFNHLRPISPTRFQREQLDQAALPLLDFVEQQIKPSTGPLAESTASFDQHIRLRELYERWFLAYVGLMRDNGHTPQPPPRLDSRISDALRLMTTNLRKGRIMTEEEIAQAVGLSLSQFKRLFSHDLQATPKSWLDRLRFDQACERLSHGTDTVKQISYELGFRSPNHFSTWFARHQGSPPGQLFRGKNADGVG